MLSDTTSAALAKALEGTFQRQVALAGNIANAETPGYRAVEVSFEDALQRALHAPQTARSEALADVRAEVSFSTAPPLRRDGNNVDLEDQVLQLGDNGLRHRVLARLLQKKGQMVREALGGTPR